MFPKIESVAAMRAEEFGLAGMPGMDGKKMITDFTKDLRAFFTVVEVQEFRRSMAVGTSGVLGD